MPGRLIGLSALANSGKDTVADIIAQEFGFVKISLADPVKRIVQGVYGFSDEQLWGPSHLRSIGDSRYLRADGSYLTPREALQLFGTQAGRICYRDTWINKCLKTAKEILSDREGRTLYSPQQGLHQSMYSFVEGPMAVERRCFSGVVIPDVRMRNELDAIRKEGGHVLRITRPESGLRGQAAGHLSETEQALIGDHEFDGVLANDGTLEELQTKVREYIGGWNEQA